MTGLFVAFCHFDICFLFCCDALSASVLCTMSLMTPVHDPVYVLFVYISCWLKWVESAGGKDIPCVLLAFT